MAGFLMRTVIAGLMALLLAAAGGAHGAQAAPTLVCVGNWSEAAAIVAKERLVSVERLGRLARDRQAEILRTTLCQRDGAYVYQLLVRGSEGVRTITTDARRPFEP